MLTEEMNALYIEMTRISSGDNLKVLPVLAYTFGILAAVKELKTKAGPLLIGLAGAGIGLSKRDSKAGILPSTLDTASSKLADGLYSLLKEKNGGKQKLLQYLMQFMFLGGLILPNLLKTEQNSLNTDVLLHALLGAGAVETLCEDLIKTLGASEQRKKALGEVIALAFLLVALLMLAQRNKQAAENIVESHASHLIRLIVKAEELMQDANEEKIAREISINLQRGRMLLESDHFRSFVELLDSVELIFKTQEKEYLLKDCLKEIQTLSHLINQEFFGNREDFSMTGILQG